MIVSLNDGEYTKLVQSEDVKNRELGGLRSIRLALRDAVLLLSGFTENPTVEISDDSQSGVEQSSLQQYRNRYFALVTGVQGLVAEAKSGEDLNIPSQEEVRLQEELETIRTRTSEYLRQQGISEENLKDLASASERIAQLNEQIENLNIAKARIESAISEIEFLRPDGIREGFESALDGIIQPLNRSLRSDNQAELARISVDYSFDTEAAIEDCIDWLIRSTSAVSDGRPLRLDHLKRQLEGVDWQSLPSLNDLKGIIESNGRRTTGEKILELLATPGAFKQFQLTVEGCMNNAKKYKRIDLHYDGKPLDQASFGQRCSAALIVLIMLGNTPIVIDEPEAHLDSSLIAGLLVSLIKEKKESRQIVFATHNANFVVNGDAELVHVLSLDGTEASQISSTSLENIAHRDDVLKLEGGAEAFRKREGRYGFLDRVPGVGEINPT